MKIVDGSVTVRRICVTTVAMEKEKVLNITIMCLYPCLSYPAGKSYLFCAISVDICDLPRSTIFFNIISQTENFSKKKTIQYKTCLCYSPQFVSETFLIVRKIKRDHMKSIRYSCNILIKL